MAAVAISHALGSQFFSFSFSGSRERSKREEYCKQSPIGWIGRPPPSFSAARMKTTQPLPMTDDARRCAPFPDRYQPPEPVCVFLTKENQPLALMTHASVPGAMTQATNHRTRVGLYAEISRQARLSFAFFAPQKLAWANQNRRSNNQLDWKIFFYAIRSERLRKIADGMI